MSFSLSRLLLVVLMVFALPVSPALAALVIEGTTSFVSSVESTLQELGESDSKCRGLVRRLTKESGRIHTIKQTSDPAKIQTTATSRQRAKRCLACSGPTPPARCATGCSGSGAT